MCCTKFCSYFEVEPRFLPIEENERTLNPQKAKEAIDENTIGVVALLGSTYTGELDDVAGLDAVIGVPPPPRISLILVITTALVMLWP